VRSVGDQYGVSYRATVGGRIEYGDEADASDELSGDTVDGYVADGGRDTFRFTGDLTDFSVTNGNPKNVEALVDGTRI
jgi:hypothetical protein